MILSSLALWLLLIIFVGIHCLEDTNYQVIIDCGSTGSRVYIYSYSLKSPYSTLKEVDSKKITPAFATFYLQEQSLQKHLFELLNFAQRKLLVNDHTHLKSLYRHTYLSLKATAGVRVLPQYQQDWLIEKARLYLSNATDFQFIPEDTKVITGGEEALYALLATNLVFINFSTMASTTKKSIGAADLGGSSQQFTFMLPTTLSSTSSMSTVVTSPYTLQSLLSNYLPFMKSYLQPLLMFTAASKTTQIVDQDQQALLQMTSLQQCSAIDYLVNLPQPHQAQTQAQQPGEVMSTSSPSASASPVVGSGAAAIAVEVFAKSFAGLGLVALQEEYKYLLAQQYQDQQQQQELESSSQSTCTSSSSSMSSSATTPHGTFGYYALATNSVDSCCATTSSSSPLLLENPCAPPGEKIPYPLEVDDLPWQGTGDFTQCTLLLQELIQAKIGTEMLHCLQHTLKPYLPQRIIAIDNFPKVLEVMNLPNNSGHEEDENAYVSPAMVLEKGKEICQQPWTEIAKQYPDFPLFRSQQVCFAASFIYLIMKDIYQIEEYDTTRFLATDSYQQSITLGWSLGAALISAMSISYQETSYNSNGSNNNSDSVQPQMM